MVASHATVKPAVIVVMGVASSGKTSLGERLAAQLGWPFRDADSFHPPENVAKMAGGTPLTDEDRAPWLEAIAGWMPGNAALRIVADDETGELDSVAILGQFGEVPQDFAEQVSGG